MSMAHSSSVHSPAVAREHTNTAHVHEKNKIIMENHIRVHLGSTEPGVFIQAANKLRKWLSRPEAYYDEIRPLIVSLLETAMETMARVLSLQRGQTFHISLCDSEQIKLRTDAYKSLVETVKPFFEKFLEVDLKKRLIEVFSTIHISAGKPLSSVPATSHDFSMPPTSAGTETEPPIRVLQYVPHGRQPSSTDTPSAFQTSQHTSPSLATNIIRPIPANRYIQQQTSPLSQPFAYPPSTERHTPSTSITNLPFHPRPHVAASSQQKYILPQVAMNDQTTSSPHSLTHSSFSVPMPHTPTGTTIHPSITRENIRLPYSIHPPHPVPALPPSSAPLGTMTHSSQVNPPHFPVSSVSLSPNDASVPSISLPQPASCSSPPTMAADTSSKPSMSTVKSKSAKPPGDNPLFNLNILRTLAAKDKSHWSKPGKEKSTTAMGEKSTTPPEQGTPKTAKDLGTAGQGSEIERDSEKTRKDAEAKSPISVAADRQQLQIDLTHDTSETGMSIMPPLPEINIVDGRASEAHLVSPEVPSEVTTESSRPMLASSKDEKLINLANETATRSKSEAEADLSPKSQVPAMEGTVIPSQIDQVEFQAMDLDEASATPPIRVLEEEAGPETNDEMEVNELINDELSVDEGVTPGGDKVNDIQEIEAAARVIGIEAIDVSKETPHQGGISLEVMRDLPASLSTPSGSSQPRQIVSPELSRTNPVESFQESDNIHDFVSALELVVLSDPSIVEELKTAYTAGLSLDFSRRPKSSTNVTQVNGTIQEQNLRASPTSVLQAIRTQPLPPLTLQDYQPKPPYQIIAAIGGGSSAGSYSIEFELGEEQIKFAKRWVDRRDGFDQSLPCICISLSCHPISDDMPEPEEGITLESLVDLFTKNTRWPNDGRLQILIEADGSAGLGYHVSPPQYVGEGEPMDLTSVIGRHNKVTFCQTRGHTEFVFFLRAHRPTIAQMRALDESTPGTEAWNAIFKLTAPVSWGRGLFYAPESPSNCNSVPMDITD